MTEESRYDVSAIRELLVSAFNVEDLHHLFSFAENQALHPVAELFALADGRRAMAGKAIEYCQTRVLLDELLAEVKEARPRAYERFEHRLILPPHKPNGFDQYESAKIQIVGYMKRNSYNKVRFVTILRNVFHGRVDEDFVNEVIDRYPSELYRTKIKEEHAVGRYANE